MPFTETRSVDTMGGGMVDDLELDNPAWRFCLALYDQPGVAQECLRLQDEIGLNVSFLLFFVWLGMRRGAPPTDGEIAEAKALASSWHRSVVEPLRSVRREIKVSPHAGRPAVARFRSSVQRVEIEAERVMVALLADWATSNVRSVGCGRADAAGRESAGRVIGSYAGAGHDLDHDHLKHAITALAAATPDR